MKPLDPLRSAMRALALLVSFLCLAPPGSATWSIVAVNRRTGEVAVSSATCLGGFNLKNFVPVIVVGEGGGAAQSAVDIAARNRKIIYRELRMGTSPQEILALLAAKPGHQSKQYGIVNMTGAPVSFTGAGAGRAKEGVAGAEGEIRYAIQGNVLTDKEVVRLAESAFLDTPGDLSQKVMAGMEAARSLGGDGRCSCSQTRPTSCGAPPPDFQKSAHVGFILLARIGDTDGGCESLTGCAGGSYYLDINYKGTGPDPDPVRILQELYADWRAGLAGRPDHLLSTVTPDRDSMPADGVSRTNVLARLVDVDGMPLAHGGARLSVTPLDATAAALGVGPVQDSGDGSYEFAVTASERPGTATFELVADDGVVRATLYPHLELEIEPRTGLHLGRARPGPSTTITLPFVLNAPGAARAPFVLVATPGTGPTLATGPERLLLAGLYENGGTPLWVGALGTLDDRGRAEGVLTVPPSARGALEGRGVAWIGLLANGEATAPSRPPWRRR